MEFLKSDAAFKEIEKTVLITSLLYGVVCAVGSVFILGLRISFLVGLIIGLVIMLWNFHMLGRGVSLFINKGRSVFFVSLYFFRLALYFLGAVGCYCINIKGLVGYVVGIMGILVGSTVYGVKGGRKSNDQHQ